MLNAEQQDDTFPFRQDFLRVWKSEHTTETYDELAYDMTLTEFLEVLYRVDELDDLIKGMELDAERAAKQEESMNRARGLG